MWNGFACELVVGGGTKTFGGHRCGQGIGDHRPVEIWVRSIAKKESRVESEKPSEDVARGVCMRCTIVTGRLVG